MYFSDHNDKITFINEWDGNLRVEGKGTVCAEDLDARPGSFKPDEYSSLEFDKIIAFSVKSIERTPELDKYLVTNKVLIRGEYNSLAERLAKELGLQFLHCDIPLGWTRFESGGGYTESTKRTLCFRLDGPPYIYKEIFTPGISAGNNGGADLREDLPEDFYVGCDLEGFTYHMPVKCEEAIMKNKQLGRFLRIASANW